MDFPFYEGRKLPMFPKMKFIIVFAISGLLVSTALPQSSETIKKVKHDLSDDLVKLDRLLEITKKNAQARQLAHAVIREPFRSDFAEERFDRFFPPLNLDEFVHKDSELEVGEEEPDDKAGFKEFPPQILIDPSDADSLELLTLNLAIRKINSSIEVFARRIDSANKELYDEIQGKTFKTSRGDLKFTDIVRQFYTDREALAQQISITDPADISHPFALIINELIEKQSIFYVDLRAPELQEKAMERDDDRRLGKGLNLPKGTLKATKWAMTEIDRAAHQRNRTIKGTIGEELEARLAELDETLRQAIEVNHVFKEEEKEKLRHFRKQLRESCREGIVAFMQPPSINSKLFGGSDSEGEESEESDSLSGYGMVFSKSKWKSLSAPHRLVAFSYDAESVEVFQAPDLRETLAVGIADNEVTMADPKDSAIDLTSPYTFVWEKDLLVNYIGESEFVRVTEVEYNELNNRTAEEIVADTAPEQPDPDSPPTNGDQTPSEMPPADSAPQEEASAAVPVGSDADAAKSSGKVDPFSAPSGEVPNAIAKVPSQVPAHSTKRQPRHTDGWTSFRGAERANTSPDTVVLREWPANGPSKIWVSKEVGLGYSGVSIFGDKLFTMGSIDGNISMICLDLKSGGVLWKTPIAIDDKSAYSPGWGVGPRGTPSYADGAVCGLGPAGNLVCVNAGNGAIRWKRNLVDDFDGRPGVWGYSESPLIEGRQVTVSPGGEDQSIVSLDIKTGKLIWSAEVFNAGSAEYTSLVAADLNGKRQYIKLFQKQMVSVEAETGYLLWKADYPQGRTAVVATPIVDNNRIFVSSGFGAGGQMFEILADNTVHQSWKNTQLASSFGGLVKHGENLFGFGRKGLICQEFSTGKTKWVAEGDRDLGYRGSLNLAGGMLFTLNEQTGVVSLVEASSKGMVKKGRFEMTPQSRMRHPNGRIWTHPVVFGGKLYLRDQEVILCYDVKNKPAPPSKPVNLSENDTSAKKHPKMVWFDSVDLNGDGKMPPPEFLAAHDDHFGNLDKNNDEYLDSKEFKEEQIKPADLDGDSKLSRDEFHERAMGFFKALDKNDDGIYSRDEVLGEASSPAVAEVTKKKKDPAELWFERADSDANGIVSKEEFLKIHMDHFRKLDKDGNGFAEVSEYNEQQVKLGDKDGDGRLSAAEYEIRTKAFFWSSDKNSDGQYTRDEIVMKDR